MVTVLVWTPILLAKQSRLHDLCGLNYEDLNEVAILD